ncbi:MAG: 2-dehydropantoate 2-reductase [Acetobacteraceae bacterium]
MKIAIVGAGSIGGLLGHRLAGTRHEVILVARGSHLQAIQRRGLTLIEESGSQETRHIKTLESLVPDHYDVIILGMKAHQVAAAVPAVAEAANNGTVIVTAQNGIPWWYFLRHGGPYEGTLLKSVDPDGTISASLSQHHIIGSVVYPAAEIAAPGVIKHVEGNRFSIGEIDGSDTSGIRALSDALCEAGFKAPILSDVRSEIWLKLWGNLSLNPISALTHATLVEICRHPPSRALVTQMMQEAQAVAEHLGVRFRVSLQKRIAGAEAVGAHKTSMLQDVEAGRQLELEALVGSVSELGRIAGIATPAIDAVYAATSLLAQTLSRSSGLLKIQPQ